MGCAFHQNCGGCVNRELELDLYRKNKEKSVRQILEEKLGDLSSCFQAPVFLKDGSRRRAAFAFELKNNHFHFGFNENKSNKIENIENCMMLDKKINEHLSNFRTFLEEFCRIKYAQKRKGKKITFQTISKGDFLVLKAENGLDLVLEIEGDLSLDHRMLISDFVQSCPDIIRFSYRAKHQTKAETIVEKTKPFVLMGDYRVFVAAGDFLQPSKEGENALASLVVDYVGENAKKIADLFCGIGTFSYRFATRKNVEISAFDISPSLLDEFKRFLNAQMISNVKIEAKNLFTYPLETHELEKFDAIVIDPPRAGALAQIKNISALSKPVRLVYVSCSPKSFVFDAFNLKQNGFDLKKITLVDQFVYSAHSELVSLWTNEK